MFAAKLQTCCLQLLFSVLGHVVKLLFMQNTVCLRRELNFNVNTNWTSLDLLVATVSGSAVRLSQNSKKSHYCYYRRRHGRRRLIYYLLLISWPPPPPKPTNWITPSGIKSYSLLLSQAAAASVSASVCSSPTRARSFLCQLWCPRCYPACTAPEVTCAWVSPFRNSKALVSYR